MKGSCVLKIMALKRCILLLFIISSLNCSSFVFDPTPILHPERIKLQQNEEEMKKEVLEKIPLNTSIDKAKQVMESSGFKCKMIINGSIGLNKKEDFLLCDRKVSEPLFGYKQYQLRIINTNDSVSDILVSVELIKTG